MNLVYLLCVFGQVFTIIEAGDILPYGTPKVDNRGVKTYKQRTLEVGVYTDRVLWKLMKAQVKGSDAVVEKAMDKMIRNLFKEVEVIFKHPSISKKGGFDVKVNTIIMVKDDSFDDWFNKLHEEKHQADKLTWFKNYVSYKNNPDDRKQNSSDINILLTGKNDTWLGGHASPNSVCFVNAAVIVELYVKGGSYTAGSVPLVAHEMGHVLGAQDHDGQGGASKCDGAYIMTPTVGVGHKTWSSCSRDQIDRTVDQLEKSKITKGNCFYV